ncbi:MAG: glycosyltransferase [Pyrinomonadaceae bacterium]
MAWSNPEVPEVVIDDYPGYLVKAFDNITLADRIAHLLEDEDLRRKLGENGRKHVDPNFRTEKMVADISEAYQMLLEKHADRIKKFNT